MRDRWPEARIADVADLIRGVTYAKDDARSSEQVGYVPVLRATNIQATRLVLDSDLVFVPEANVSATQKLRAGDIVVATSSGSKHLVGKSALLGHDWGGSFGAFCAAIRPTEAVDPRYLASFLQSPSYWKQIGEKSMGVNINNLRRGDIESVQLPLPDLDEQRRVVAEIDKQFSRLDEAVANLQRVKANLKRYKAAVLKAAVEGRLVETEASLARREGRGYETGDQLLQRILEARRSQWVGRGKFKEPDGPKRLELPEVPEGWTWATLPQLGELNRGKSKHRPRDDKALYGGPYPFIQTGDVRRSDGSIAEFSQTYSELGLQQSRLWPAGTLCITIAANIAETGILQMNACFPDSVVGFMADQGQTTTEYVEVFIRTAKDNLDRFASATAQKNINLEVLQAVAVPVPPMGEQRRIVDELDRVLSILRGVGREVDANLQRAQALRNSVLCRAFLTST